VRIATAGIHHGLKLTGNQLTTSPYWFAPMSNNDSALTYNKEISIISSLQSLLSITTGRLISNYEAVVGLSSESFRIFPIGRLLRRNK